MSNLWLFMGHIQEFVPKCAIVYFNRSLETVKVVTQYFIFCFRNDCKFNSLIFITQIEAGSLRSLKKRKQLAISGKKIMTISK